MNDLRMLCVKGWLIDGRVIVGSHMYLVRCTFDSVAVPLLHSNELLDSILAGA